MSLIKNPRNEQTNAPSERSGPAQNNAPKYLNAKPLFLQPRKFDPKPIEDAIHKEENSNFGQRKNGLTKKERPESNQKGALLKIAKEKKA